MKAKRTNCRITRYTQVMTQTQTKTTNPLRAAVERRRTRRAGRRNHIRQTDEGYRTMSGNA